jgi:hypothetical protein
LKPSKKAPESTEEAISRLEALATSSDKDLDIVDYGGQLIANGLIAGAVGDLFDYAEGLISEENSSNNKYECSTLPQLGALAIISNNVQQPPFAKGDLPKSRFL